MAIEFKLPDLGENIESGDIVSVLVKEGDIIKAEQGVVEIETDKAVIEVPSTVAGKVTKVHVKPGATVKVGETLLTVDSAAAAKGAAPAKPAPAKAAAPAAAAPKAAAPAKAPPPAVKAPAPAAPATKAPAAKPAAANGHSAKADVAVAPAPAAADDGNAADPAGPAVRRLARELGVDLSRVNGSGPGGRITREDVIAAVRHANTSGSSLGAPTAAASSSERDNHGPIRREKLSKMRRTIAVNMTKSATTIPQLTNFDDADITELERIRKASAADYAGKPVKLTSLAFVMKAVALSLKAHPTMNATIDMESEQIIYKDYYNLGIAVDTPRGLVVPVIRDVDRMTIPQVAAALTELAEKARNTQHTLEDLRGGSFTISNLGSVGGVYSTPIINPPEVGILLVGRARKLPVVVDDNKIEPRLMMPLSLTYDHRLVDGATAARFLNDVIAFLESPGRLLLAT